MQENLHTLIPKLKQAADEMEVKLGQFKVLKGEADELAAIVGCAI